MSSCEFAIQEDLLERNTLSSTIFYFKGQRASGDIDRADRHLPVPGEPGVFADLHGGWYDATGDYGIHLSHQNPTSYFNPQQVPLVAWVLLSSYRLLGSRHNDNFSEYERRLLDEGLFGADFLTRMHRPNGSFFESITAPGKQKLARDREIGNPNWRTQIKKSWAQSERAVEAGEPASASCLNCELLNPFREKFLADLNTIPRDTHTASETMNTLRAQDWSAYWPQELAGQVRLKNFVVELYLSGNGSLIFSNAFVQWASSEVLRRARPRVLVACFGMRPKPKPFTGIAIFENQSKVSTVPDADDPENSAIDAGILARYIWLSALRYPEHERALCVCVAEHLNSAWVVAPPGSELDKGPNSISSEVLYGALTDWMAS